MSSLKKVIAIIIIIIIVIISDIILANNTKKSVNNMISLLNEINSSLENQNINKDDIKKINDKWKEIEKVVSCYIDHDEIEKISKEIKILKRQIEIGEYNDAKQSVTELEFLFNHIENKQTLNIENFF